LKKLTDLRSFSLVSLRTKKTTKEGVSSILQALKQLTSLKVIELLFEQNGITDEEQESLNSSLRDFACLQNINASLDFWRD